MSWKYFVSILEATRGKETASETGQAYRSRTRLEDTGQFANNIVPSCFLSHNDPISFIDINCRLASRSISGYFTLLRLPFSLNLSHTTSLPHCCTVLPTKWQNGNDKNDKKCLATDLATFLTTLNYFLWNLVANIPCRLETQVVLHRDAQ